MNDLTLKQLIAVMSVNQHLKQCLSDSLRFEEKRVKFRPCVVKTERVYDERKQRRAKLKNFAI